ncbi:FIG00461683: hypothetical protein [Burkholderia singularis]|uniref:Uncharacterized protein n=2 Tax=Burkholderia singularis TaxID=1503053 RepID=A0A238H7K7_9BURK|nr:FIG00461683: hypothetical protein [Burkholderia singularis]
MDACQSISRSADAFKYGCSIDGEWPDSDDKTFYEAELNLLERLVGLLDYPGQPEPRAEVTDTERLDWLIAQQAWIQWTVRDGSIRQCQVYDQDEDENYHILSGDDRYFNTPREAIDAAREGDA